MSKINTDKFILDEQTSDIEIADISGVFKLDPAKIDAAAVYKLNSILFHK